MVGQNQLPSSGPDILQTTAMPTDLIAINDKHSFTVTFLIMQVGSVFLTAIPTPASFERLKERNDWLKKI